MLTCVRSHEETFSVTSIGWPTKCETVGTTTTEETFSIGWETVGTIGKPNFSRAASNILAPLETNTQHTQQAHQLLCYQSIMLSSNQHSKLCLKNSTFFIADYNIIGVYTFTESEDDLFSIFY